MNHKIVLYIKKHWSTLLFGLVLVLLLVPSTGLPIKVFINRLVSWSPSVISGNDRKSLDTYHWELESLEGESLNLNQSKGKVVIINVWATWCPPCLAELPSLERLYKRYGDRVDFYFVSQESVEVLSKFLVKKGYQLPVYRSREAMPESIETRSLPTTYIISQEGEIAMAETGAARWGSEKVFKLLDSLLSNKAP